MNLEGTLKKLMDSHGYRVSDVLEALGVVCIEKADHIRSSYQDEGLARHWDMAGQKIAAFAGTSEIQNVSV